MKVNLFNCARKKLNKVALLIGLGLSVGAGTGEAGTTYSGTLTADSPSYFSSSTPYYYAAYTFTAPSTTSYTFNLSTTASGADPFISLYSSSGFDPSNPSTNSLAQLGDTDSYSLTSGTRYTALVLLGSNVIGDYTFTLTPSVSNLAQYTITGTSVSLASAAIKSSGNIHSSTGSTALTFNNSLNVFYNYLIDNTITDFTKASAGTLTLAGANNYTGSTTVSSGTLSVASGSIPSGSTINLSGGKLGAAASFTLPNAVVLNSDGAIDAQGQDLVLSGNISGSNGLTITSSGSSGVGSVSLTGSNSYTGATTVTSGKLKMSSVPNSAQVIFTGGSFKAGASFSMANSVVVNSTTFDTNGYDVTLSGQLSGANLAKSGAGTLTLSGISNLSSGTITLSAGTLAVQSAGSLGNNEIDISLEGGTLKAVGTVSPTSGNSISVNSDSSVDTNGYTFTLLGSLTLVTGKQLEVKDSGSGGLFDVSGSTGSSSAGTVKITGGTYRISDALQLGASDSTQILNGGTLKISNSANFDASTSAKTLQAISMTDSSTINTDTYTITMANAITASSGKSFTKAGTGTMILSAANTFSGPVIVSAGELRVSNIATQLSNATYIQLGNGANLKFTAGGVLPYALVL
jgi:fibronectin-binding autotransporter adhesin